MVNFWIIAATMVAVVMFVILRPLLGAGNARDSSAGSIRLVPLLAVLLPAAAVAVYMLTRAQPEAQVVATTAGDSPAAVAAPMGQGAAAPQAQSLPSVGDMLGQLEERLRREPDDASGWNLLGKSYEFLGRREDADNAFAKARELGYVEGNNGPAVEARVHGVVRLDPGLVNDVSETDTVFVYARAVSGPRMPLAVVRKSVSELPFEFELNDAMAMSPAAKLSQFKNVVVGARISSSGDAIPQAGDLEGFSDVVTVGQQDEVTVIISQAVIK